MNPSLVARRSSLLLRSTHPLYVTPPPALNKISLQPHQLFSFSPASSNFFFLSLYHYNESWFLHLSKIRGLSEEQKKELGVAGIAKLAKKSYKKEPQKEELSPQRKRRKQSPQKKKKRKQSPQRKNKVFKEKVSEVVYKKNI